MIKTSLKNFVKNLVYLFIPMGIIYLFLLIIVFGTISSVFQSLGHTLSKFADLVQISSEQSSVSINDFLAFSLSRLDWDGNIFNTIRKIIDTNWIQTTLRGFFETINASAEGFEEQFQIIVNEFTAKLSKTAIIAMFLCALGVAFASYATRFAIQRRTLKIGIKKAIIANTVVPIVQALIIIVSLVLLAKITYFSFPVIILFLLFSGGLSLFSSWIIHKNDSLKLKNVLTIRNILSHLAVQGIILLINILVALILFFIDSLICIMFMVPFAIYSFNIADVNTEYFVSSLTDGKAKIN